MIALVGAILLFLPGAAWGTAAGPSRWRAQSIEEQQWHLAAMGAHRAHEQSRGDGVVVAVVDSGVDDTTPDLAGALLPGTGFGSAAGTDGTADEDGHGTAMATLIAGRAIDGGALGVAPAARILPVSVGSDGGRFTTASVASGITWAVDNGADVINLSLTSEATLTPDLLRAVNYAFDHDVVVVAGTGNAGQRHVGAPANIRGVIAVAGTEQGNAVWASSNTGPETVLAAPAAGIVTAVPVAVSSTGYASVDGTSAATALVSGAAALVRSRYPDLDAGNVVNRLVTTALDLGEPGRDDPTGFGLVDLVAALSAQVAPVDRNPLAPPPRTTPAPPPAGSTDAAEPSDVPRPDAAGGPGPTRGVRVLVLLGGSLLVVLAVVVVAVLLSRRPRAARPEVSALPPPSDEFWRHAP
ncbi:S8 family serine peptidase [Actinosynnema sp. NPDC047251]|uniref:S8 family serine peptidase n=1 Tax=Saccharothrix espanaensis TaxID=103731 RepID=UPI0003012EA1|nr:S8 family serine peptidase [Saccharothrix espanaensis]